MQGYLNIGLTLMLLTCVVVILAAGFARWLAMFQAPKTNGSEI